MPPSPMLVLLLLAPALVEQGPALRRMAPGPIQSPAWERHEIDVAASDVYVVTHRSGLFSFLGHEHAIIPIRWSGEACAASRISTGAWGSLLIETSSLVIDSDSARTLAGLGGGPDEEDVEEIQGTLLDPDHLAAEGHPEVRLESRVAGALGGEGVFLLRSDLTLRGRTRELEHEAEVRRVGEGAGRDEALRIRGSLQLRQTDFGIEPESVAGVVNVKDEVDLHFDLVATPTGEACEPWPSPGRTGDDGKAPTADSQGVRVGLLDFRRPAGPG